VDLKAELTKCDKKLDLARLNLDKIRKVESQADYEETVPANVRLINEDKVRHTLIRTVPSFDFLGFTTNGYRGKHCKLRSRHWRRQRRCS
jgi:hypothetical protein